MPPTNKPPAPARLAPICSVCGKPHELIPSPTTPGRLVMFCPDNPAGPVYETDALDNTPPQEESK